MHIYKRYKRYIITILLAAVVLISPGIMPGAQVFAAENDETTGKVSFDESEYRQLKSHKVHAVRLKGNLTSMINESSSGYAVVQGGCTDGKYAYYLMVSSTTQHGRVLKVRIKDRKVVRRSKVLNTWHGNGMAYDSKRKKLVVVAREHRKQEITLIDAKTLKVTRQENVKYKYYKNAKTGLTKEHQEQGLGAIAYVERYDCYIALERTYHNLLIFDPDTFQAIGFVRTDITDKYPGSYQAIDADEKYVYFLLSACTENYSKQPHNLILALDWNSEKLLPVVNAGGKSPKRVKKSWYCGNKRNGKPDAVLRINTRHEAENIYHTVDKKGREHFYLSEYYSHLGYSRGRLYTKRSNYVYSLGII